MVSGFLISPNDQDRIFSGEAIEIRIGIEHLGRRLRVEEIHDLLVHAVLLFGTDAPSRTSSAWRHFSRQRSRIAISR